MEQEETFKKFIDTKNDKGKNYKQSYLFGFFEVVFADVGFLKEKKFNTNALSTMTINRMVKKITYTFSSSLELRLKH